MRNVTVTWGDGGRGARKVHNCPSGYIWNASACIPCNNSNEPCKPLTVNSSILASQSSGTTVSKASKGIDPSPYTVTTLPSAPSMLSPTTLPSASNVTKITTSISGTLSTISMSTINSSLCRCASGTFMSPYPSATFLNNANSSSAPSVGFTGCNISCLPCPLESYQPQSNFFGGYCFPCVKMCAAGFYLSGSCTSTTTPVCVACPPNTFSPLNGSQTACNPCQSCLLYSRLCQPTSDAECFS